MAQFEVTNRALANKLKDAMDIKDILYDAVKKCGMTFKIMTDDKTVRYSYKRDEFIIVETVGNKTDIRVADNIEVWIDEVNVYIREIRLDRQTRHSMAVPTYWSGVFE